jgi:6,7-dimethyl-8-ribityllumazine synthase
LREFLELLGCRNEAGAAEKQSREVTLSMPLAKIAIGWDASAKELRNPWNFSIEVDDPDTAHALLRKKGYEILSDLSEYQSGWRQFVVRVLPGFNVAVLGSPDDWMGMKRSGVLHAEGRHFAIVVSRFNSFITQRLAQGAVDALSRLGAQRENIRVVEVPGAFEIPSVSRSLAGTREYDAIICIGCLLRGDTAHYDVIVNEVTRGIGQSAQETGVPHAFGVLTCDTLEQAIDRAGLKMGNKGFEAALAAVEMASLKQAVSRQPSALGKTVVGRRSSAVDKGKSKRKAKSHKGSVDPRIPARKKRSS